MPPRRSVDGNDEAKTGSFSRTDRLLATLLLVQQPNATLWEKIRLLRSAGLTNPEIGELLGMTGAAVAKTFYDATRRSGTKKLKKRK
jgi:hypothetical protein